MLNKEEIRSYHENGFLIIRNVFSDIEINRLKERLNTFKDNTLLFFRTNVYNASNTYISPFKRSIVKIISNFNNNAPKKKSSRPDYICYGKTTALKALV